MIQGKVTGQVWSSRHLPSIPKGGLLEITVGANTLIAFDPLGCAIGEDVLITQGSVAAGHFGDQRAPVDALIIASIDPK